jgi:hypothetical protein
MNTRTLEQINRELEEVGAEIARTCAFAEAPNGPQLRARKEELRAEYLAVLDDGPRAA